MDFMIAAAVTALPNIGLLGGVMFTYIQNIRLVKSYFTYGLIIVAALFIVQNIVIVIFWSQLYLAGPALFIFYLCLLNMTVIIKKTESQKALSSTKFEGKLQLALEGLNPSIRRSLLRISKRNSAYIIDYIINELKRENNASLNYVRMNIYAIVDLVKHCKKSDVRIITREDVLSYLDSLKISIVALVSFLNTSRALSIRRFPALGLNYLIE
jgi:hypothetical protein